MREEYRRQEYRRFLWAWLALMALLGLTLGGAYLKLGAWNIVVSLGIAIAKALIVLLLFMHLGSGNASIRIYAVIGLFTLSLLFLISGSDYFTRSVHDAPWHAPPPSASPEARIQGPAGPADPAPVRGAVDKPVPAESTGEEEP